MASDSPHFGCFKTSCQCALFMVGWMRTIFGPQQSLVVLPEPHVHGRVLVRNGLGVFEGVFDIVKTILAFRACDREIGVTTFWLGKRVTRDVKPRGPALRSLSSAKKNCKDELRGLSSIGR